MEFPTNALGLTPTPLGIMLRVCCYLCRLMLSECRTRCAIAAITSAGRR